MTKKQGYFELKLNDESMMCHFSMTFLHFLTEVRGIELHEIGKVISTKPTLKDLSDIIFCAHKAYCVTQNPPLPFDYTNEYDFLNIIGESGLLNDQTQIVGLFEALAESQMFQNDSNMGITRKVKKSTKNPK